MAVAEEAVGLRFGITVITMAMVLIIFLL